MIFNVIGIILITIIDQISKIMVQNYLKPVKSIPLIEGVFHLTYAQNQGAAFSILEGRQIFLMTVTIVAIGFAFFMLKQYYKTSKVFRIGVIFVIGGAIGNFIDRLRLGYVIDMFDFRAINFAVFNVADSFITVGAVLIAVYLLKNTKEVSK